MARKIGSRYSIDRVVGRGTCGTVWLGTGPAGPVAVKLLREDLAADQTLIARFVQERTVLTSLVHPNIVAVRDLVVDGTDLALIMDLVEGDDLRGYLDRHRALRPAEAAALAADVAAALAAAHARGVVHRDVKPENVLLDHGSPGRGGLSGPTARLTDFGIARLVDGPRRTRATRIVGTPDYLAPEVIEGCPAGPPVDVYALGTVLFELITGWTPFGGGHPGAVLRRHVTETFPDVPGMPPQLAELLAACLSKAPAARLTAAELAVRLRELAPELAGLPALRIPEPRGAPVIGEGGDPVFGRPMQVGALPLVRAMIEDEGKQTHVNLIRPIREPLGPGAPAPRGFGARSLRGSPAARAARALREAKAARDAAPSRVALKPGPGRGAAAVSADSSVPGGFPVSPAAPGGFGGPGGPDGPVPSPGAVPPPLVSPASAAHPVPASLSASTSAQGIHVPDPDPSAGPAEPGPKPSVHSARSNRIAAFTAVLAAGLVAAGGTVWWQSGHGAVPLASAGVSSAGAAAAGGPLASVSAGGLFAAPAPTGPVGPLGLSRLATAPAAPAEPVGAVAYAGAGPGTAVLAATGTDGVVRVAVAVPGSPFTAWQELPGLASAAGPSLVGRGSGQVEIFAVAKDGGQVERSVYRPGPAATAAATDDADADSDVIAAPGQAAGSWSPWAPVGASGAAGEKFTGDPAAVLQPDGSTLLLATSESGRLWSAVAAEPPGADPSWQGWQSVDAAGPVKPGLALAVRGDGSRAAFVTRARDAAVLRVSYDGRWEPAWPTGAVGLPAAAYTASGRPYLFVQEITGDIQVFEPSGADLHGTMTWTTAGVTTQNPPGVGSSDAAVTVTTVAADGSVAVYRSGK
ncbi:MAG TPA: protein kinase [Actinocrinis sp.]|nr:protein kinase [Actinocrinis sp.]